MQARPLILCLKSRKFSVICNLMACNALSFFRAQRPDCNRQCLQEYLTGWSCHDAH